MYGKCGSLHDAQRVFHGMHLRDVVSWNCILAMHADHKMGREALVLCEQMQQEGVAPDRITFISLLSACTSMSDLPAGEQAHFNIVSRGFEVDVMVGNALVNMYAKCGSLESARLVFDKMPQRSVVSWNTIVGAYAQQRGTEAMQLFDKMQKEGVQPNKITFLSVISACPLKDALRIFDTTTRGEVVLWNALISVFSMHRMDAQVIQLYHQMQLEGVVPNKVTFISVVSACSSEQVLSEGKRTHVRVVSSGLESDVSLGNALINMYHKCNSLEHAESTFHNMSDRNVVSCTAIVSAYVQSRKCAEAMQLFDHMQQEGLLPDKFAFAGVLDACASLIALAEGKRIHTRILAREFDIDVVLGTALLNMYSKCGSLEDAKNVFELMPEQNTVSFNAMISACAHHGQGTHGLELFDQMHEKGIVPDAGTFMSILSACSHTGLLGEGICHFFLMHYCHDIIPSVEHYDCLIDLLGRAGQLNEAEDLIIHIHANPTAVSFRTLLGACRHQADVERGEHAANQAFLLEPENEGCYLLLSNMYAAMLSTDDMIKVVC